MRPLPLALLIGLLATPSLAQEVLFLRIRPHDASRTAEIGTAPPVDEVAAARAAREAVWERADSRARLAIASVCTGCLPAAAPRPHSRGKDTVPSVGSPAGAEGPAAPTGGAALDAGSSAGSSAGPSAGASADLLPGSSSTASLAPIADSR